MRLKEIGIILVLLSAIPAHAQLAIGSWRDHFSYNNALSLAVGNGTVYAAYRNAISYHTIASDEIGRINKAGSSTGDEPLSDVGIMTIACHQNTLVVAYDNSNIDILQEGRTYNISDIKRLSNAGDKTIYGIDFYANNAYIATGLGIVVIDLNRHEIVSTYPIGSATSPNAVKAIAIDYPTIYTATTQGLYSASLTDKHLNINTHWTLDTTVALAHQNIATLACDNNTLVVLTETFDPLNRMLYYGSPKSGFALIDSGDIQSVRLRGNLITESTPDGVKLLNCQGATVYQMHQFEYGEIIANDAIVCDNGSIYVAHDWAGLLLLNETGCSVDFAEGSYTARDTLSNGIYLSPNGNVSDNVYNLTAYDDNVYLSPGGLSSVSSLYIPASVYIYHNSNGKWDQLDKRVHLIDTLTDVLCVAVDPKQPNHLVAASWNYGIIDIWDGKPTLISNESNSQGAIQAYIHDGWRSIRTGSVAFDADGNLWGCQSLVDNGLFVRYADGTWNSFNTTPIVGGDELTNILCDSVRGYKWLYGRANRIYVHDGAGQMAYVNPNHGSHLQTNSVNSVVQDRSGDIWIGTNKGIKVIYNAQNMFDNGGQGEEAPVNCSNIVISNGDFVEYLMAYENISCIAVDGANQKWIGTQSGGLYLISANGLEELHHFTTANSPLPSNHILAITVQPNSGEVFIGTDHGTV
ncbi:MAG: hypothetical protein KBT04_08020, partial [Bacteroidales bacterium]|nr:hypothetical protein [Candidatus Colimorpha onthohippi]